MKDSPTQSHVLQLSHPPIPVVRIGIIGLGNRGLLTLQRYLQIEGIEINALCEIREGNLAKAQQLLRKTIVPEPPDTPDRKAGKRCASMMNWILFLSAPTG